MHVPPSGACNGTRSVPTTLRTPMAHTLFSPEVKLLLEENNPEAIKTYLETLHPATVAESLTDFPPDQVWPFLKHTSIKNQAAIFEYFPIEWQVKMVEGTGREHMAG